MAAGAERAGEAGERVFFLAEPPTGVEARLRPEEARHAVQVLRVRPGERISGLDGLGRSWPLVVQAVDPRDLRLVVSGDPTREPAPGEDGAPLPWIEVAVSLPRAGRAEDMLDRLVQLGMGALRPLVCERTQRGVGALSASRLTRLHRTAEQACKQSRRTWVPSILPTCTPAELGPGSSPSNLALLEREGPTRLVDWAHALEAETRATRERPLVLAVGPEGGWTAEERAALIGAGAAPLTVGPHVLRIATAAEAALAALVQVLFEA